MNIYEMNFKVLVRCFTFNQSKYVLRTLNGFTMQQTNFPYVCCIVDDASTEGEQDVLKDYFKENFDLSENSYYGEEETDYANICYAQHKQNKNCFFVLYLLKYNHYSIKKDKMGYLDKWYRHVLYEAMCEGDDYWFYPHKLQKQSDALDEHPECTIAFNRINVVNADDSLVDGYTIPPKDTLHQDGLVDFETVGNIEFCKNGRWCFQTSSMMFRSEMNTKLNELNKTVFTKFPYGDMKLLMTCLWNGRGYFINEIMGCYRQLSGGYNSTMKKNPELRAKHALLLSEAFLDADAYTKGKYHKYLKCQSMKHKYVAYGLTKRFPWFMLYPKYWCFFKLTDFIRKFIKGILLTVSPTFCTRLMQSREKKNGKI